MSFYIVPPVIKIEIPVLDRWLDYIKSLDQTQAVLDAVTVRLKKTNAELRAGIDAANNM